MDKQNKTITFNSPEEMEAYTKAARERIDKERREVLRHKLSQGFDMLQEIKAAEKRGAERMKAILESLSDMPAVTDELIWTAWEKLK